MIKWAAYRGLLSAEILPKVKISTPFEVPPEFTESTGKRTIQVATVKGRKISIMRYKNRTNIYIVRFDVGVGGASDDMRVAGTVEWYHMIRQGRRE